MPGIARIRYTTSHPGDMDASLIQAHRDQARLMPFLHLPVQSGSNGVLAAMRRRYTRENYFALVDKVRDCVPGIAISTDMIVGPVDAPTCHSSDGSIWARFSGVANSYDPSRA